MKIENTKVKDLSIINLDYHGDNRGWFMESYNRDSFHKLGIDNTFVQDNRSFSASKGTLRGLHYQRDPHSQAKLVSCIKGKVLDVAVDLRKGSPTYLRYEAVELSEDNKRMLFIPRGFAHGYLTLTDNVEFEYKCDNLYNKDSEGSIRYDDPTINIDWKCLLNGLDLILSEKDKTAPLLKDCNANFTYEGE